MKERTRSWALGTVILLVAAPAWLVGASAQSLNGDELGFEIPDASSVPIHNEATRRPAPALPPPPPEPLPLPLGSDDPRSWYRYWQPYCMGGADPSEEPPSLEQCGGGNGAGSGGGSSGGGSSGGGSSGGGGTSPPSPALVHLDTQEYAYGNWRGYGKWFRVTNDADANNRYYVTITRFLGSGTTNPDSVHDYTDIYHLARGWGQNGNTFFHEFNPTDAGTGSGTIGFTVGPAPSATYSWTQERPAELRYELWDYDTDGWDDQMYGNRASFVVFGGNSQYRGWLEWGASGVIPTGASAYMYLKLIHHAQDCPHPWCSYHIDDTGWKSRPMDWA